MLPSRSLRQSVPHLCWQKDQEEEDLRETTREKPSVQRVHDLRRSRKLPAQDRLPRHRRTHELRDRGMYCPGTSGHGLTCAQQFATPLEPNARVSTETGCRVAQGVLPRVTRGTFAGSSSKQEGEGY